MQLSHKFTNYPISKKIGRVLVCQCLCLCLYICVCELLLIVEIAHIQQLDDCAASISKCCYLFYEEIVFIRLTFLWCRIYIHFMIQVIVNCIAFNLSIVFSAIIATYQHFCMQLNDVEQMKIPNKRLVCLPCIDIWIEAADVLHVLKLLNGENIHSNDWMPFLLRISLCRKTQSKHPIIKLIKWTFYDNKYGGSCNRIWSLSRYENSDCNTSTMFGSFYSFFFRNKR